MKALIIASVVVAAISTPAFANCGGASWYSLPRNKTASGERMNPRALTAAHRSLKFGTRIRVTNQHNGKSVTVRINDRGPFVRGRILDLSKAAAAQIGMIGRGHAKVCFGKTTKVAKKKIKHKNIFEALFSKKGTSKH